MHGESRLLINLLNQFGIVSSTDIHDRFVTAIDELQRNKSVYGMHSQKKCLLYLDPACNKYCDLIVRLKYLSFIENHVSSVENHACKAL